MNDSESATCNLHHRLDSFRYQSNADICYSPVHGCTEVGGLVNCGPYVTPQKNRKTQRLCRVYKFGMRSTSKTQPFGFDHESNEIVWCIKHTMIITKNHYGSITHSGSYLLALKTFEFLHHSFIQENRRNVQSHTMFICILEAFHKLFGLRSDCSLVWGNFFYFSNFIQNEL